MIEILQAILLDQNTLMSYFEREREHSEGKRAYELCTIGIVDLEIRIEKTRAAIEVFKRLKEMAQLKNGKFIISTSQAFYHELFTTI